MKWLCIVSLLFVSAAASAQNPPYDSPPEVAAPYYRVRYAASDKPGELIFPVQYTVWIPEGVEALRGVIVHQHGCGEGSCKSGQTGAFDLHWQALAAKHDCALLSPSYEQPEGANCQMWCDPRNGSGEAFQRALRVLGEQSGHPELATAPWALWGHSGGGHWCGGMLLLHPERVAAAWLRSGVPLLESNPDRDTIQPHELTPAALEVPIMCNLGTREGVTVTEGKFAGVWPANEAFFRTVRGAGGLIGVAVDPVTSHECGNQRYLAIPWLDTCLTARLPGRPGAGLGRMPIDRAWLAYLLEKKAVSEDEFGGGKTEAVWLPDKAIAATWMHYVKDTEVPDTTAPPAPANVQVEGREVTWKAVADLESGIRHFLILRDGQVVAKVEGGSNQFGRPVFQGLQYSDTPVAPLAKMQWVDEEADGKGKYTYEVVTVNTAGLRSDGKTP